MAVILSPCSRAFGQAPCVGDCAGDGRVTVDDLLKGVNIVLSTRAVGDCLAFDTDSGGTVTVNELVQGVRALLEGCIAVTPTASATLPSSQTATPTGTSTPEPTETPTVTSSEATSTPTETTVPPTGDTATPTVTRVPSAIRPNISVLNLDDTRADGLDRMPVLQQIASQGVIFRNSFAPFSVCAPSRASLFSGLYAHNHGTRGVTGQIGGADTFRVNRADRQTIAVWLQAAGYETGLFGKYINDYAATESNKGPNGTFYVPPGWTRWRAMTSPEHYGGVRTPSYQLVDERGGVTIYDDHATDAQYSTDVLAQEVRDFIADAVDANHPFFAVWTPYASHADQPNLQPEPAERHYDTLAGIGLFRPPNWNEADRSDKPRWVNALPVNDIVTAVSDQTRQRAYETLLAVDEQLDLIMGLLRERGVADNTALFVTSDNGACWGEHAYFGQGKGCIYEECIRVPMIVSYPRLLTEPRSIDAPVLNIDVAPTVAALAGVVVPVAIDGRSFAPWMIGATVAGWRQAFPMEYRHELRGDTLFYTGQVVDGDRVHVLYGNPRVQPRIFATFEFDGGDGNTGDNAYAVEIGADANTSFMNLGTAIATILPGTTQGVSVPQQRLTIFATNGSHLDNRTFVVDVDQRGVMRAQDGVPDHFGLRDVTRGYAYAEYETGEVELYDLVIDPAELENKADDPAYVVLRAELAQQLKSFLGE